MPSDPELHPRAHDLFPEMSPEEFGALVEDIREHGLLEDIWLYEGKVIDGRHRQRACRVAGVEPRYRTWNGDDAGLIPFVVSLNAHRRHMTELQRAVSAAAVARSLYDGGTDFTKATTDAGALMAVKPSTVQHVIEVQDEAPELIDQQLARGPEGRVRKARKDRETRRRTVESKRLEETFVEPAKDGAYRTIVMDPPWDIAMFSPGLPDVLPYPTMTDDEIAALPVPTLAHPEGCHLYVWVTHGKLPLGLELVAGWGFKYRNLLTWEKNGGLIPWAYSLTTEHVIVATRGKLDPLRVGQKAHFAEARREHSRKPEAFYDIVRQASPAPRLEMFAREPRDGYILWGNDVAKFAPAELPL